MNKLKDDRVFIHSTIKKQNQELLKKISQNDKGCISKQLDYIIEEYARQHGYKTD